MMSRIGPVSRSPISGRLFFLGLCTAVIVAGSAYAEDAIAQKPLRVLLVTGCDYEGHHWKETSPVLRAVLEEDKRLEVRIVDDIEFLACDTVFDYDVLLMHFKNYDVPKRLERIQANLKRFVGEGGGLVYFHFACGAFQEWDGFVEIAGRAWDPQKRAHDPHGPFMVRIVDREHPVTKGLDDFEIRDELYTCLGGDLPIHVLAEATSKVDGKPYPMAFVFDVGKGRVFHTVLGHDVEAVKASGLGQLMRRACLWAGGREL